MTYLYELERELAAAGVRGRAARRVLDEARDHLAELGAGRQCEFGAPRRIAHEVAAVLATSRTQRAAVWSFAALTVTGIGYLVAFALVGRHGSPDIASGQVAWLGLVAAVGIVFLPQLTFVAGLLMIWRALRLPGPASAEELALVRRRAAVALGGAAATLAAWTLFALEFRGAIAGAWLEITIVALAAALVPALIVAGASVRLAAGLRAAPGGRAGDMFDDLAPIVARTPFASVDLRAHPWRFAAGFAVVVGLVATAAGWNGEGTLADGLVRGVPEAIAVVGFYAAFGRTLGLRPRGPARD
jgi:hypothetical protein